MTTANTGEITALLRRIEQGDAAAHEQLARLVRSSLKRIAANRLRREQPGHPYSTSDLVHEAYLRLFKKKDIHWEGGGHFFKMAATEMRRILIEIARKDPVIKLRLEDVPGLTFSHDPDLLKVNEVFDDLARIDPRRAEIAELKYFSGYGIEEIARITGIPRGTVKRHWATAKAFIKHQLDHSAEVTE
jgi:RNA polymerase sigma factor (TIGR02999 family)